MGIESENLVKNFKEVFLFWNLAPSLELFILKKLIDNLSNIVKASEMSGSSMKKLSYLSSVKQSSFLKKFANFEFVLTLN